MKEIIITENDAGQRVDKCLMKMFPKLTKSMMYKAIRNKKIKVNRKRCQFDQILQVNDSILLFLPPDVLEQRERTIQENKELEIVYEDENLLIVNKPYGLLSQSDQKGEQDCLVSRIQSYLYSINEYDPKKENSFAPAICHRLDRNTTGLVIAAKNASTLRIINEAIASRHIHKYYQAKVVGTGLPDEQTVRLYIKKDETKALVSPVEKEGYKEAILHYSVKEQLSNETIVNIELMTGRFHQIRATFSYLGHPLIADVKYGYKGKKKKIELKAYKLVVDDIPLSLSQHIFEC